MAAYDQPGVSLPAEPLAAADERRILYELIRTVSSSFDLERVLQSIVALVSEGTQAQSCYIWIVEREGRLVLRAASDRYAEAVGRASMRRGEGFAGWVVDHREPIFIAEDALADPRARYFPEFEEEKYQSMVSVPLIGKAGDAFGVISLHAPAPRVFTADDARFVLHAAALAAGAVENARLYEATRRRLRVLQRLAVVGDAAARAASNDDLLPVVVAETRALLEAEEVHVYLAEAEDRLVRRASAPGPARVPQRTMADDGDALVAALWRDAGVSALAATLAADGALLGYLVARSAPGMLLPADARDVAGALAVQAALGIKKVALIEGLTEKNLMKDVFADLVAGASRGLPCARAASAATCPCRDSP